MRMTLIKISTLGLGLLAVIGGFHVQSNETPEQALLPTVDLLPEIERSPAIDAISDAISAAESGAIPKVEPSPGMTALDSLSDVPPPVTPTEVPPTTVPPTETAVVSPEAVPSQAPDPLLETTIYPGQAVGPITADTTREDLVQRFGQGRLEDIAVHVGEGFIEAGTRVDLGETRSFSVIWNASGGVASVRDFGSAWATPAGLRLGTSLRELEAMIGPFELFGFGFDYGGTVVFDQETPEDYNGLIVRMRPELGEEDASTLAYRAVLGDDRFSSQHESFNQLEPKVYEMIVVLSEMDL